MSDPLPSFSIRVSFARPPHDTGEVIAELRKIQGGDKRMADGITLGMQMLTLRIQKDRFTGKGPFPVTQKKLGVVSGRLRRDLYAQDAEISGGGYRSRIGAAVEYFGAHEMGFDGTVQVPAHTRSAYTTRRGYSVLEQSVRAHSKTMKVPKRQPLRAGIEEHSMRILGGQINKTVKAILATKGGQA